MIVHSSQVPNHVIQRQQVCSCHFPVTSVRLELWLFTHPNHLIQRQQVCFNISPPRAVIVHSSQPSDPASTGLLLSLPSYMFMKRKLWFSLEISYLVNGFKSKTINLLSNALYVTIVYLSYCVIFLAGMSQTVHVWSRFSQNHNVHHFDIWIAVSVFPCFEDFCYIFYFALIKQIN